MTDVETTPEAEQAPEVTEADMISRGKGVKLDALEDGSAAAQAVEEFKALVEQHKTAEAEAEALKDERNQAIYVLKSEHNVSFSAIAEIIGGTSSLVLYLYERAQGKSAKQIREESQRSRAAKEQFRESDPNAKPARKQTAEEKSFRKQQREALQAFLAEEKAKAAAAGETSEITDDELQPVDDEG